MKHSHTVFETAVQQQHGYAESIRKPRVLLVESDNIFRRTLSSVYSKQGYTISVATNLTEALEFLSQLQFSLIIYNLKNPFSGGLKKLETIMQHSSKARVLVTSSFSEKSIVEHVKLLGADAFLSKPIKRADILKATEEAL
ncbi:MAG: response regulator [bacterium]